MISNEPLQNTTVNGHSNYILQQQCNNSAQQYPTGSSVLLSQMYPVSNLQLQLLLLLLLPLLLSMH